MDSAALYHAVSPTQAPRQARLCLSMGTNCLRSVAGALQITFDPDPIPTAGTRLTKEEFADGFERLEEVHFPLERNLDESWRHFQGWRVNYESIVDALTKLIMPPPAPWFLPRPGLGRTEWPGVRNRTPDDPDGTQPFRPGISLNAAAPGGRNEEPVGPGSGSAAPAASDGPITGN